jgi:hypothetical protein
MFKHYASNLFLGGLAAGGVPADPSSISAIMNHFFIWDQICSFGAGLLWVSLHFYNLKKVGKLEASWVKVVGFLVTAAVLTGPGAAMVGMWWWREEMLARWKVIVNGNGGAKI